MSPDVRSLEARVDGVRSRLRSGTLRATAIWSVAALSAVLLAAWLLAGPDGWRQGSDVPLVLDLLLVTSIGSAVFLVLRGMARWFAEAPLASAIERSAGLRT